jgi:hypothetical protein
MFRNHLIFRRLAILSQCSSKELKGGEGTMVKAKKLATVVLTFALLGSLAGCIWVDRGGYYRRGGDYCRYNYCR